MFLSHQITELSSELADERNTGESASQLLETETSERLRLEKDMKDLQVNTELCWRHHICSIFGKCFFFRKTFKTWQLDGEATQGRFTPFKLTAPVLQYESNLVLVLHLAELKFLVALHWNYVEIYGQISVLA